ncbi:NAD(P)H-binding protein [Nonomuraea sp. H19]|uniref:NAD(P)H-binding protein n=1 Tax=Nonomuraea sp. H19 TaxID=3452206 RepID=UPI003F8BFA8A
MTILITGARGAVAKHLAALLRERGLDIRTASKSPGADVVCDLGDASTFPAALKGATSVFLYADPAHIDAFVKQAAEAGVEHIVLLSSSAVLAPDAESQPLAKSHLDVEHALWASSIKATTLRPGSFASNALSWTWTIKSGKPISLPYPGSHTDPIHEADVADVALAVLTNNEISGKPYTLTGPQSLTFAEQIAVLAEVTGVPIEARPVTREEWKAEMADYIPAQFADGLLDWWQSTDGRPVQLTDAVERLTGHPARTFATWAADHAGDFS